MDSMSPAHLSQQIYVVFHSLIYLCRLERVNPNDITPLYTLCGNSYVCSLLVRRKACKHSRFAVALKPMSDLTRREHLALLSSVISLSAAACCCSSNLNASLEVESAPIRRDYPHFARDGSFLAAYDPKRSILARTLFQLTFYNLQAIPS